MPWEPSTREIETLSEEAAPDSVTGKCFSTVDPMQIYFLWISHIFFSSAPGAIAAAGRQAGGP